MQTLVDPRRHRLTTQTGKPREWVIKCAGVRVDVVLVFVIFVFVMLLRQQKTLVENYDTQKQLTLLLLLLFSSLNSFTCL